MVFSAVFTYYDLICLKLSILFLALGNVKTKLFIAENEKKKNIFGQRGHKIRFHYFGLRHFNQMSGLKEVKLRRN